MITVFTPTYNRAHLLMNLYKSLLKQTQFNFEWVIVDDGSTDNTKQVVDDILKLNSPFDIRYYYQNNHGKHAAVNLGVDKANGDKFFIVDSDDWLPENAIEKISFYFDSILDKENFAGVGGLRLYPDNKSVGDTFNGNYLDCTTLERAKNKILGDKAEVFYTDILKRFPFPVFDGENFISEELVWARIAKAGYKIRWFNEGIYFCEYLEGGLTNTKDKEIKNFQGFKLRTKELLTYKEISLKRKIIMVMITGAAALKRNEKLSEVSKEIGLDVCTFCVLAYLGSLIKFIRRKFRNK